MPRSLAPRILLLSLAVVATGPLFAQTAPIIRTNTPELGCFLGGSYGIDKARVMGGCNFVYSIKPREVMPFAEVSYFPGIGRTARNIPGLPANDVRTFTLPITDFNAGVHIRIIPPGRVIPYGVLSFGLIRNSEHQETFSGTNPFTGAPTSQTITVPSATTFTTSFGGGLRVYATEHVGFRGEFKAYKPVNNLDMFYRVTGGFFYQF